MRLSDATGYTVGGPPAIERVSVPAARLWSPRRWRRHSGAEQPQAEFRRYEGYFMRDNLTCPH